MSPYEERGEEAACRIIAGGASSESDLRELLILSCHSCRGARAYFESRRADPELLARLVTIAVDEEDHEGDAPMQAAYYAEEYPPELLRKHASSLLRGFPVEGVGYNGALAIALAKAAVPEGKAVIEQAYERGYLSDDDFAKAMELYRGLS